ncbi:MAG TPA: hypothetical protein VNM91_11530, partial [Dehalococcoidia bacterium]|nr:hypothetical protein [Dehalococcoidia bacterium]
MDPYRVLQLREGAPRDLVEEVYWALIGRAKHEHPAERDFALRIRELNAAYDAVVRSMDEARDRAPGPKRAAPPQRRFWRRAAAPTTPDDLYGLLHVDEQADHDVIALAARFALNQLRTRPDQQARLLAVQAARDVLLDRRLRAEYDAAAASRLAAGPPAEATAATPTTPAATASPSAGTLAGPTSPAAPRPAAAPANASTVNAGPATPTPAYADAAQHAPPSGDAAVHASASTPPTPAESAATQA